jgi:methionyl-tRNA formyltransferase
MKIIFFGTPFFAAEILSHLIDRGISVEAVVTQKDTVRGKKCIESEVKKVAKEFKIFLYQPEKASDEGFIREMKKYEVDLFVVVAYGQILKKELLKIPKFDCINIHASLLPKHRGAAPIQRCLMEGHGKTGVSIIQMIPKLDAGDIILKEECEISEGMSFGELERKLLEISKRLLLEVIGMYEREAVKKVAQGEEGVSYAKKIFKEEYFIEWSKGVERGYNLIRALSPSPGARCNVLISGRKKVLKILKGEMVGEKLEIKKVLESEGGIVVGCGDGGIKLLEVQLEGKRVMDILSFLRGIRGGIEVV